MDYVDTVLVWLHERWVLLIRGFTETKVENYIRLVAIVGAYLLLRPFLMRKAAEFQGKQHEKEFHTHELGNTSGGKDGDAGSKDKAKGLTELSNAQQNVVELPGDEKDEGETSGANWGKKARKRQAQVVKKMLAQAEEEESDEEIDKFLEETYGKEAMKDY
jgi:hypothetical protein